GHRLLVPSRRPVEIALHMQRDDPPQVIQTTELRARLGAFEKLFGALHPTRRDRNAVTTGMIETQIDCEPGRPSYLADVATQSECPLAELDARLDVADPHRPNRRPLKILKPQGFRGIGAHEPRERARPIR